MSIVAVHGPNTMYTTEGGGAVIASAPPGATATKSGASGLVFNFAFPNPGARPASDFNWTFTGPGNPVAQAAKTSGTVTFTGPGAVTIVCTVAAGAGPPAAGAYTVSAVATAGTPRSVDPGDGGGDEPEVDPQTGLIDQTGDTDTDTVYDADAYGEFILADHSIAAVKDFLGHYELTNENVDDLISEEEEGANRVSLLDWLNTLRA